MADEVLKRIVQRMIDAGEPEEAIAAVIQGYKPQPEQPKTPEKPPQGAVERMVGGLRGFERATTPQAIGEAISRVPAGVLGMIKTAFDTVADPEAAAASAMETIKNLPATIKQAASDAIELARSDPEGWGEAVGNLTVDTGLAFAGARAVPVIGRPAAAKTGALMERIGTSGAWPIRIRGAHQLGSKNPLGIVTMGMPEALTEGGRALQKFGNKGVIRMSPPEVAFGEDIASELGPSVKKTLKQAGDVEKKTLSEVDKAIAAEKKRGDARRSASAKREAELKAAEKIEKAKEGKVPSEPVIKETVKAPGQTMTTTYGEAPDSGLSPLEEELLKRATSVKPVGSTPKSTFTPAPAVQAGEEALEIPRTQSRNPLSAADDRLTTNDMDSLKQIIQDNPGITAEEATAELVRQRGQRSQVYRSDAGLSRLEQSALDRELP